MSSTYYWQNLSSKRSSGLKWKYPTGKLYEGLIPLIIKGLSFASDFNFSSFNIQSIILVTLFSYWRDTKLFSPLSIQNLVSLFSVNKLLPSNSSGALTVRHFLMLHFFPYSASLIFTVVTKVHENWKSNTSLLNTPPEAKSAPYSLLSCLCI